MYEATTTNLIPSHVKKMVEMAEMADTHDDA
jgi:hypothetical protein